MLDENRFLIKIILKGLVSYMGGLRRLESG